MEGGGCGRTMTVLFGSQTGSAEDSARRIGREGFRLHLRVRVSALDEYNLAGLVNEPLVMFVVATTGQGDPPDNMKNFWRFIWRRKLPSDCLAGLRFGVLGFGDSSYQKFNFIAKKLRRRLIQLGGNEIIEAGFSDDQHDYGSEFVVGPWINDLMTKILRIFPLSSDQEIIPEDVLLPSMYQATFPDDIVTESEHESAVKEHRLSNGVVSEPEPFYAVLTNNKRVTAVDHWQDVRLLTLDISGSQLKYSPGDICYIQPKNMSDTVDEFLQLLGLNSSDQVVLKSSEEDDEVPTSLRGRISMRYLAESFFDINSIPRMYFWKLMMHFTDSDLERSKLQEFCTPLGQEDLFNYCNRPKRSILEVMKDFPGSTRHIPFSYLFDMIPPVSRRAFSIASSQSVNVNRLQLLVAIVKYKTSLAAPRRGVCSNYLANLNPSSENPVRLPIWISKGMFEFPVDPLAPVIMVGPGTGCAPFRAYLEESVAQGTKGKRVLFFGCRNQKKDFFFEHEWRELEHQQLLQLFVAFSRDQSEKVYVQHILAQQSDLLWDLIEKQKAHIFIAGNSKNMPDSVRLELKRIVIHGSGSTDEEADDYLTRLASTKRFQLETWS